MYSLYSVTVREEKFSTFERSFYFPGIGLSILFPIIHLVLPQSFQAHPIDYFEQGSTSWLDLLLVGAYTSNLVYYSAIVWQTRRSFQWDRLKRDSGARLLLYIVIGSGSATLVLVLAYLFRDIHLLFASVLGTVVYAVTGYLAQIYLPEVFREIGPSMRDAYRNSRLEGIDTEDLENRLDNLMSKEKIYLQEDLSLTILSSQLDIKPYQLSEFLSQIKGTNFSKFVNGYRVAEAVRILEKENGANILSVAYRSGFNSKATFNLAFKSIQGVSPREFLRKTKVS